MPAYNSGGSSKGISIELSFDNIDNDEVKIEEPFLIAMRNRHNRTQYPLEFIRMVIADRIIFHVELPEYYIYGGLNKYSSKLLGKAKADATESCAAILLFTPYGSESVLKSMKIEITPHENPDGKVVIVSK